MSTSTETTPNFELTERQVAANRLLGSDARHILLRGGSRSGKTFLICRAIFIRALKGAASRHVILRLHGNHARESVWLDTLPKVANLCYPEVPLRWNQRDLRLMFPSGSEIWVGGLDDKERVEKILGKEYATLFFNECSQIPFVSVQTALTRLAQKVEGLVNRAYYDCNPPVVTHWTYTLFRKHLDPISGLPINADRYAEMQINPTDNLANLPDDYLETLDSLSELKRQRFKLGEWAADVPGALWSYATLEKSRATTAPDMRRIVVAMDPASIGAGEEQSEHGIIVGGLGVDGNGYVLADQSLHGSPEKTAKRIVDAYDKHNADAIVVEVNNGGDWIPALIKTVRPHLPVKKVRASRGKITRAEPISALYDQGRIKHVGQFPELEDQMVTFTPDGLESGEPADRVDALVWAFTKLFPGVVKPVRQTDLGSQFGPRLIEAT